MKGGLCWLVLCKVQVACIVCANMYFPNDVIVDYSIE